MKYYSTKGSSPQVSFSEAIMQGLAPDGGLYMPVHIPRLADNFIDYSRVLPLPEIAQAVLQPYMENELTPYELLKITEEVFNFEIPLIEIGEDRYIMELFHGPTLAFKDVGARFLARCLSRFNRDKDREITVLVATSGDTGGAVAHGFHKVPGIRVVILYPSGNVSDFQEAQITGLGDNIQAVKIEGTFDDCQSLVKQAFMDPELSEARALTSANSINIGRLLPQIVYYVHAFAQLPYLEGESYVFSVPSGNYGNLTAGLIARKMGLPIDHFLACSNINDTVPHYLDTGEYKPKPSLPTLSNAMDVGAPNNFERILELYKGDYEAITKCITGYSFTDEQTLQAIRQLHADTGYILDPHAAVGYLGMTDYLEKFWSGGVLLETANPYKFRGSIEEMLEVKLDLPPHIEHTQLIHEPILMSTDFSDLRDFLLS